VRIPLGMGHGVPVDFHAPKILAPC
jgi:hypothetical protein